MSAFLPSVDLLLTPPPRQRSCLNERTELLGLHEDEDGRQYHYPRAIANLATPL
jgi:hypothetical protein